MRSRVFLAGLALPLLLPLSLALSLSCSLSLSLSPLSHTLLFAATATFDSAIQ
eukprot:SAG22_NODE_16588_length_322_cov_0.775785_2_plen_52_part_01